MGSKINPGSFDCYHNAEPDEPMFIVLARDASAPIMVRAWAETRKLLILQGVKPMSDLAMVVEAHQCADNMEQWAYNRRKARS